MNNTKILKVSLEKAEKNRFNFQKWHENLMKEESIEGESARYDLFECFFNKHSGSLIFDPEFGKAFFGEEQCDGFGGKVYQKYKKGEALELWQHHQHRMLDEIQQGRDPVLYLESFL